MRRKKNLPTSKYFLSFMNSAFSFNCFSFSCETLISSKENEKNRIGIMDKVEFEDLGIEIWIRLFQGDQSIREQIEEVKKKHE